MGVGAQGCVNPDNFDYGFGHAITPLIHASVGKLFNYLGDPWPGSRMLEYIILEYGMPEGEYNKMKNKKILHSTCRRIVQLVKRYRRL